jgi:hypothetical protein
MQAVLVMQTKCDLRSRWKAGQLDWFRKLEESRHRRLQSILVYCQILVVARSHFAHGWV